MPGSASQGFGSHGLYGPLTLDYNERARGLTLAVSLWLQPQRINLKGVTKVCEHPLRWHVIQISLIGQKLRPLLSYRSGRKSGGQKKWSYTKLETGQPKGGLNNGGRIGPFRARPPRRRVGVSTHLDGFPILKYISVCAVFPHKRTPSPGVWTGGFARGWTSQESPRWRQHGSR